MTNEEKAKHILSKHGFVNWWAASVESGRIKDLLEYLDTQRGVYAIDARPSDKPHIQTENNGGVKAWEKVKNLMINPPLEKVVAEENDFSYVNPAIPEE